VRRERVRTTPISQFIEDGWRELRCEHCNGTGYADGRRCEPPIIPARCTACGGRGASWRSPRGLRCAYPGAEG